MYGRLRRVRGDINVADGRSGWMVTLLGLAATRGWTIVAAVAVCVFVRGGRLGDILTVSLLGVCRDSQAARYSLYTSSYICPPVFLAKPSL